jgi:hypothetical protein
MPRLWAPLGIMCNTKKHKLYKGYVLKALISTKKARRKWKRGPQRFPEGENQRVQKEWEEWIRAMSFLIARTQVAINSAITGLRRGQSPLGRVIVALHRRTKNDLPIRDCWVRPSERTTVLPFPECMFEMGRCQNCPIYGHLPCLIANSSPFPAELNASHDWPTYQS